MQTLNKKTQLIALIVAIVMTAAAIGFSVAFGVMFARNKKGVSNLESLYETAYYETLDSLNNAHIDLKKVAVIDSKGIREDILLDIWNNCTKASENLGQLSGQSEKLSKVIKMLNQMGDYARYLSKKTSKGFSADEKSNIATFISAVEKIKESLISVQDNLINGDKLNSLNLSSLDTISGNLDTIDYSSIDYPELIYDGPFSDGLSDREAKNLKDAEEISKQRAQELVTELFDGASDISFEAESETTLAAYFFTFKYKGLDSTVSLSKKGGKVVLFNTYKEIDNPLLDDEECIQKAEEYVAQMGYEDMKAVWISNNNSTVYVNFAYEKNNVVYYPDLVKIKLSGEDGTLLGVEAQNYLYNHSDRDTAYPASLEKIAINADLEVKTKQVCIIPTDWNKEILCLEVVAVKNEETYYIYYNVETGDEERILILVDEDGQLLI